MQRARASPAAAKWGASSAPEVMNRSAATGSPMAAKRAAAVAAEREASLVRMK